MLLAWNADTVLVSFRGTASLANALADIQVHLWGFSLFLNAFQSGMCYGIRCKDLPAWHSPMHSAYHRR